MVSCSNQAQLFYRYICVRCFLCFTYVCLCITVLHIRYLCFYVLLLLLVSRGDLKPKSPSSSHLYHGVAYRCLLCVTLCYACIRVFLCPTYVCYPSVSSLWSSCVLRNRVRYLCFCELSFLHVSLRFVALTFRVSSSVWDRVRAGQGRTLTSTPLPSPRPPLPSPRPLRPIPSYPTSLRPPPYHALSHLCFCRARQQTAAGGGFLKVVKESGNLARLARK